MTAQVAVELDGYGGCARYTSSDPLLLDVEVLVAINRPTKLRQLGAGVLADSPRPFADAADDTATVSR